MAPELLHTLEADELRDIAGKVKAYQEANKLADNALVRLFPDLGSTKTYTAILAADLDELNLERQLTNYRLVLALMESGAEKRGGRDEELYDDFVGVARCKKVLLETMPQRSIARLIIVEGDTGAGKSSVRTLITAKYQGRILNIEATVGWGDSPGAMCNAILKACGVKEVPPSIYERTEKVIELLAEGSRRRCLMVEEAHHMGVRCLNLLKTLINRTPGEFVLLTYPTLWARLEQRAYHEARQLTGNRLAERIRLQVDAADVKKFVSRRVPNAVKTLNGKFDQVIQLLVARAPRHGNLGFVREVCDRVLTVSEGTDGPSFEQWVGAMDAEVSSR
jgi:DNA transposition AAA+ family ATPase